MKETITTSPDDKPASEVYGRILQQHQPGTFSLGQALMAQTSRLYAAGELPWQQPSVDEQDGPAFADVTE